MSGLDGQPDLELPLRSTKPRDRGLTCLLDPGAAIGEFEDLVSSHAALVDYVKLGWGTCLIGGLAARKIAAARRVAIRVYPGGTAFEKFALQRKLASYRAWCRRLGFDVVEVSNGTIELSHQEKARWVASLAGEFEVISEVGYKDVARANAMSADEWVDCIRRDLDAGAGRVVIEARETGEAGICDAAGRPRADVLQRMIDAAVPLDRVIFEAPTRRLQSEYVLRFGADVNLGNVAMRDVLAVESLRLGLRSDTMFAPGAARDAAD
jgi:phosphosulfolactate synthase